MEALSTNLAALLPWLLKATLQGSLLVCLIALIKIILRDRLPARWHYALWLVLLLRLALPWTPQSSVSIYNWIPRSTVSHPAMLGVEGADRSRDAVAKEGLSGQGGQVGPSGVVGQAKTLQLAEGTTAESPQADLSVGKGASSNEPSSGLWPRVGRVAGFVARPLPWLWLAGAISLAGYILIRSFRLWRAVRSERPVTDQRILDLLEDCKMQMRIQTIVAVVVTDKIKTPVLFGFLRPRILLPQGLVEAIGMDDLEYVFLHELAHLKRHDIYVGWLVSLVQVLHWFNPLVWLAFGRMRMDQETAADALALSRLTAGEPAGYGHTIMRLLEGFSQRQILPSVAGILEDTSHIERRIHMIAKFKSDSYPWSVLGVGVIMVLSAISMVDPPRGTVSAAPAGQEKVGVTMRLVEKRIWGAVSMSPDRRYLCHTGWATEEITIQELATGEQRTIKPKKRLREEWKPDCPTMSPDNKTVAYLVAFQERADLCLIGADGSGQRVLYPGIIRSIAEPAGSGPPLPYPGMVRPIRWFPDGSHILAIRWPDPMHADRDIEIVSVSVADGSVEVIKALAGEFYGTTIRLSPDAKVVACELTSKDAPKKHDIFAIEIDSKRETPLIVHAADDRLLDWMPDGNGILFMSDRIGPWSLWLLPVANGQAQGVPELVARSPGNVKPIGFAENGSYYYGMSYHACDIHTAAVNLATGQVLSAPAPLEAAGSNQVADWSPDGKYLAYCSHSATSDEPGVIRIRSLATGQERELVNKLTGFDCLRWSPDGRSLLASWLFALKNDDVALTSRVYRIDAATGEATVLLDNQQGGMRTAELSPDGKTLYYTTMTGSIIRREIDGGLEKTLFTYPPKGPWAGSSLSPNGEFIAVGSNVGTEKRAEGGVKKILLIPSKGGEATELLRWDQEPASFLTQTAWSPDGKTVLFTLHREPVDGKNPKAVNEFWQVPTDGGQPRKIMETDLNIPYSQGFRVHPDGQRIAFSVITGHGELWAMENLLPAGAGAKDTK